jgi:hypothetical protein
MRIHWSILALTIATTTTAGACGGSSQSTNDRPDGGTVDAGAPPEAGASPEAEADAPHGPPPVDYVIVAADPLAASAQRYRDFRASGHTVDLALVSTILNGTADPTAASQAIHDYVQKRYAARDATKPFDLLIIGDADSTQPIDSSLVPVGHWPDPSTGQSVSTDDTYADMDGDGIPDLAVGRIAVRSDADVDAVRAKVAANDSTYAVGLQNRRLNLFASTSGFGEPIDTMIENMVFQIIEEIPYDFDITMTYAKQTSPYVYVPEQFSDKVYDRINEGALMVTYVGHGDPTGFATLDWSGVSYAILDTTQLSKIAAAPRAPILTLIACATGAFDTSDCVSEQIQRDPVGPVAVMSSTENSHPYPNAIFIRELGQVLTATRPHTLGEAFVSAKDRMIHNDDALRQSIDAQVGALLTPDARTALLKSHLYMYTLFGDPAMAIAYPGAATLVVPAQVSRGAELDVTGTLPGLGATAQATVTLETARSTIAGTIQTVPADGDPTRDGVIEANYSTANDKTVVRVVVPVSGGALSAKLNVPATVATGTYHAKVYADDGTHDVAASASVTVQ